MKFANIYTNWILFLRVFLNMLRRYQRSDTGVINVSQCEPDLTRVIQNKFSFHFRKPFSYLKIFTKSNQTLILVSTTFFPFLICVVVFLLNLHWSVGHKSIHFVSIWINNPVSTKTQCLNLATKKYSFKLGRAGFISHSWFCSLPNKPNALVIPFSKLRILYSD